MEALANPSDLVGLGRDGRKLIAVVYADVVGYSRLIGEDDLGTIARLRSIRTTVIDPAVGENGGRVVQTGGDSLLIVFDSVAGAVRCAVRVQTDMHNQSHDDSPDRRILFRIGINLGDAIADGTELHGDSVNVAVRLQEVCPAGGICISRPVHEHIGGRLELNFQPMGALTLKNITRSVEAYVLQMDTAVGRPAIAVVGAGSPGRSGRPSLAVLPFTNQGNDADDEYLADGMAEDIITELSRSGLLFVIARNSSFSYKHKPIDVRQIAQELGVRYVHEGTVRRSGGRIRISAQLIDAETRHHLWADRYECDFTDLFALQDCITKAIVATIQPVLSLAEQQRALRTPVYSLTAWETYQRGAWHRTKLDPAENIRARELFQRAIELDPTFARPQHALAQTYYDEAHLYFTRPFSEAARLAEPFAHKAVLLDPNDADAYVTLALVSAAQGDLPTEMARARRAREINPNCAAAYGILGQSLVFSGRYDEGCQALMSYLRRNPCDPRNWQQLQGLAIGRYLMGEYAAAVDLARRALAAQPNVRDIRRWLIAALGMLGRNEEAQAVMRQSAAVLAPIMFDEFARRQLPWVRDADQARLIDGLRRAGWQG